MAMNSSMVPKTKIIDFYSIVRNLPVDLPEQKEGGRLPITQKQRKRQQGGF
jgi:hypothetical protein